MPTTPVNMIGAIPTPSLKKEEVTPVMEVTRARAQDQAQNDEPPPKPLVDQDKEP